VARCPKLIPAIQELKTWRRSNKLSQAQAARVLKAAGVRVTWRSLQNWEIGHRRPDANTAMDLSAFLKANSRGIDKAEDKASWKKVHTSELLRQAGELTDMTHALRRALSQNDLKNALGLMQQIRNETDDLVKRIHRSPNRKR
jgi:transcriptional regulator with XRE-family HTH domain